MLVMVMSDTHGELDNLKSILPRIREINPDLVVHLGDNYEDAELLRDFPLLRVPGVYESYYSKPEVPNRIILNLSGWLSLLTHSHLRHENDLPWDPDPQDLVRRKAVDLIIHGHTHIPRAELIEGVVYINPGHMKKEDKKGYPPTFSLIEAEEELKVRIIELSGRVMLEKSFTRK
ncbi:metallophosphoesterase family protein [Candidatus Methanodesulfokora washburnensis]|uniref:Phosphoesterase n=1 Tax=Candidatus Methanodesulfokora washburnensis TaxID=2478471 RepID=A0A3R9PTC5_9CREN|nr:YfcE family phosphodiesterase [Candidatus Methanodesulfokores washburnensis]RSN72510.1 YfcE family phosphodiesterase [Candidatus Methanodesulfokores washburnensis]